MTQHPYADILRAIADGHQIERRHTDGIWRVVMLNPLLDVAAMDRAAPEDYRIKPRTIRIGEFDVPEPLRVAPTVGSLYWSIHFGNDAGIGSFKWNGDRFDQNVLIQGVAHLKREDAEAHTKALLSLSAPR